LAIKLAAAMVHARRALSLARQVGLPEWQALSTLQLACPVLAEGYDATGWRWRDVSR
jgi:hypothetical protein